MLCIQLRDGKDKDRQRFADKYGVPHWFKVVYNKTPKGMNLEPTEGRKKKGDADDDYNDDYDCRDDLFVESDSEDDSKEPAKKPKIEVKKVEEDCSELRRSSRLKVAGKFREPA